MQKQSENGRGDDPKKDTNGKKGKRIVGICHEVDGSFSKFTCNIEGSCKNGYDEFLQDY